MGSLALRMIVAGIAFVGSAHAAGPDKGALDCFKKFAPKIDDQAAAILCNAGAGDAGLKCFLKLEPDYDDAAAALVCADGSQEALQCFKKIAANTDDLASAMICTHRNALIEDQE
jgi:hypothetical protein